MGSARMRTYWKMAAYGKDEFVTGSDLSDLSDFSDHDLDSNEVTEIDYESEDDGRQYCLCGEASTMEMIACDDDQCAVVWWHYSCAGVSADAIPDTWICSQCLPGTSTEEMESPPTSRAATQKDKKTSKETEAEATDAGPTSLKKKKARIPRKPAVQRPEAKYCEADALRKASDYFKTGLKQLQLHPVCLGVYPTAVCMLTLVMKLISKTDTPEFQEFISATVSGLWLVATAGDSKYLKPEGSENLWKGFHKYRLGINDKWIKLLQALGLHEKGQHVYLVCQFLLQAVLLSIIEDRNSKDKPIDGPAETKSESLSPQEEQVLRYVSGYIPFSLHKQLSKQKNDTAVTYSKFLKTWKVDGVDETARTFLKYTNDWVEKQNRGGLFCVSDGVYLLFRAMERETCKYLTMNNLKTFQGCDIQTTLLNKIMSNRQVQTYWCSLTQSKISGDTSTNLLKMTVKKWIKIRAKAFINVYLNLKKATSGNIGKKAEKALRKDL